MFLFYCFRTKRNYIRQQYNIKTSYLGYSRSSLFVQTVISDPKDNQVLGRIKLKHVYIDPATRKSKLIPDWFKQDFRNSGEQKEVVNIAYKQPQLPDSSAMFRFPYKFVPSDTDLNGHVNNTTYYRLCLDVAAVASVKYEWFDSVKGDLANYNCIKASGLYAKECGDGEEVMICTWEDKIEPYLLHFRIMKSDVLSFATSMTFQPRAPKHKL